jgi:hypothetical protein
MFHALPAHWNIWLFWSVVIITTICWFLLLFGLSKLSSRDKKYVIMVTTFLCGLYYVLQFFIPEKINLGFYLFKNPFSPYLDAIGTALMVMGAFTLLLGVINMAMVHGRNITRLRKGWYNSLAFFVALFVMILFGIWNSFTTKNEFVKHTYDLLFKGFYVPLNSTMFSLLAFYMATAAYRAFRLRSGEATVLVVAAFLVMLGQVPVGVWLTHWLPTNSAAGSFRLENIALWLLGVLNMAGLRAVGFGIGIGALAIALRMWLNLERGAFFEQEM